MCYMDRIGLRELRQHASRYIARVAEGDTVEVTVRGRVVARIVPAAGNTWADLITGGQVMPATSTETLLDEPPMDYRYAASTHLEQMRAEER